MTHLEQVHFCGPAKVLRTEIAQGQIAAQVKRQTAGLAVPHPEQLSAPDVTDMVMDEIAARLGEFERLHDAHHSEAIAEYLIKMLQNDKPREDQQHG